MVIPKNRETMMELHIVQTHQCQSQYSVKDERVGTPWSTREGKEVKD